MKTTQNAQLLQGMHELQERMTRLEKQAKYLELLCTSMRMQDEYEYAIIEPHPENYQILLRNYKTNVVLREWRVY